VRRGGKFEPSSVMKDSHNTEWLCWTSPSTRHLETEKDVRQKKNHMTE